MRLSEALAESAGLREKEKELLLNQYGKERKSKAVAFVLLLLLGPLGAHKFYQGKVLAGVIYCVLGVLFIWAFCLPTVILSIIDIFFLYYQIDSANTASLRSLKAAIIASR